MKKRGKIAVARLRLRAARRHVQRLRKISLVLSAVFIGLVTLALLAVGVGLYQLSKGPISVPQLAGFIENRLNDPQTPGSVKIGSVTIDRNEDNFGSAIILADVHMQDQNQQDLLVVPEMRADFSLFDVLRGQLRPQQVRVRDTAFQLQRSKDGNLNILPFVSGAETTQSADLFESFDGFLQGETLSKLTSVTFENTSLFYHDLATDRQWNMEGGSITLDKSGDRLAARAELSLMQPLGPPTKAVIKLDRIIGSPSADISLQIAHASPVDLADLIAAFDWLRVLQAPVSGAIRMQLSKTGKLASLDGVIEIGKGQLAPDLVPQDQLVSFDHAKAYFEYDSASDIFNFSQIRVDTSSGEVIAQGYAQLQRRGARSVTSLVSQLTFDKLQIDRPDLFQSKVGFEQGALDFSISFQPLALKVGRLKLTSGSSRFTISGLSRAQKDHWQNEYTLHADNLPANTVKSFWPLISIPNTRNWVVKNVHQGAFKNFTGGIRTQNGKPEFRFSFDLVDIYTKFMPAMPVLQRGQGWGYLTQSDLQLVLKSGHVMAPDASKIQLAGTTFTIPDITRRPAPGVIDLKAKGSITAGMLLMNLKPFEYLNKGNISPKIATGQAQVMGRFKLPLKRGVTTKDVDIDIQADLFDVTSKILLKDKDITADKLVLAVGNDGLVLQGPVRAGPVPAQAKWRLPFGAAARKGGTVDVDFSLTPEALNAFNIALPSGMFKGATPGHVTIRTPPGQAPLYSVTSGLIGARLTIPGLPWSKPAGASGKLSVQGRLGTRMTVDDLRITAPGLAAHGRVEFGASNNFSAARFSSLKIGNWFNSSASVLAAGNNNVRIETKGGQVDLRRVSFAGSGGSGRSPPTDIHLDRLQVTDSIYLSDFRAQLRENKGLRGVYSGNLNGGTTVTGKLLPHKNGMAVELKSRDGGGVLRSSGLFGGAHGGRLTMWMVPLAQEGSYDGSLLVENTRVRNVSAMADLLNAISVVGLVQQLNGSGIHFTTAEGQFNLRPNGVKISKASAVGPSMGITIDGWYDTNRGTLDFQGVTTPIYAINGTLERIFGKLVGRQKGEGLFGFTYNMTGRADNPNVVVNPLSILTPGLFRQIFRRPIPPPK